MKKIGLLLILISLDLSASTQSLLQYIDVPTEILKDVRYRNCMVYLPPSYNKITDKDYPVLYLLHGGGCANTQFETEGHLQSMADSLINAGIIGEMIIVCPDANQDKMIWFNDPDWRYEDYFFTELIPYIEQQYKAKTDKANRSIGGFSMGGGAAVGYAIHHPEKFCSVYAISAYLLVQPLAFLKYDPLGAWRQNNVLCNNSIETINHAREKELISYRSIRWFIDCGDDDFTFDSNMSLVKAFRTHNIPYELRIKNGGHHWSYWYPALVETLKSAF